MGSLVDPIPNSLNQRNKNCMTDSRENYQWDLESVKVNDSDVEVEVFKIVSIKIAWLWDSSLLLAARLKNR